MKKIIVILLLPAVLLPLALCGKTVRRTLGIIQSRVPESSVLAHETMELVYDYKYCVDTTGTLTDNYESDRMLLQISDGGLSKFSSYTNLTVDSLIPTLTSDQMLAAASDGKLSNGEFMTTFKNWPAGHITNVDKICDDWFRYQEETPVIGWRLTDGVETVLGYECRKAECDFRGRHWTVLYAEDIPVMDGPWKLHGLPGLILKATADGGLYGFECVGIKSRANRPITIYDVPFNTTTRPKFYDTKHRYDINPYAYYEAMGGGHVTVTDAAGNPVADSYDPIELQYDYIETDWR
ncbi:MAG: GLPGLI family protein [Muribaculaceae bacterium]|nr:GLPGLI family protein [Muribaculaceae bacterium]